LTFSFGQVSPASAATAIAPLNSAARASAPVSGL
jgi:hypothetical protein